MDSGEGKREWIDADDRGGGTRCCDRGGGQVAATAAIPIDGGPANDGTDYDGRYSDTAVVGEVTVDTNGLECTDEGVGIARLLADETGGDPDDTDSRHRFLAVR